MKKRKIRKVSPKTLRAASKRKLSKRAQIAVRLKKRKKG
jgi:hypothetical protein